MHAIQVEVTFITQGVHMHGIYVEMTFVIWKSMYAMQRNRESEFYLNGKLFCHI